MRIWRGPNVWRLDRLLSVPQINLSARADRKMVIFYVYLRYFTKKSRLCRTDTQIKKKFVVQRKNLRTPSYAYLRICIFSKEITALQTESQTERHIYTRFAWAGGTFFTVVQLYQFLVLAGNRFWFYILM